MFIKKNLLVFLLLFIITLPTFSILLNGQYFTMHDDQHIARLYELEQGIRQGAWYPRWVGDLGFGFGYPLFNFYPPLIYYISLLFHIVGFSYITSIKCMIILGILLGTFGIYLFARKTTSRFAGFASAVLFAYFAYRATSVYVRGALAEFFTTSLLPFVFLTFFNLYKKHTIRNSVLFGITLALMVIGHLLVTLPAIIFLGFFFIFYIFLSEERLSFLLHSLLSGLIGFGLSAFFWIPSLLEKKFTFTDKILTSELADYVIHFVYPHQLWYSPWGFGGSIPGPEDGISFAVGKIYIGLTIISFILFLLYLHITSQKKQKLEQYKMYALFLFMLLFSFFMMIPYSNGLWRIFSPLAYLQFPWRFLSFVNIFIALVAGATVHFSGEIIKTFKHPQNFNIYTQIIGTICIVFVVILIQSKYFKPFKLLIVTDAERTSREEIAWNISKSSFEFVPNGIRTKKSQYNTTVPDLSQKDIPKQSYEILMGQAKVLVKNNKYHQKEYFIQTSEQTIFRLNTFNFPGWTAYLNGTKLDITDDNDFKLITVVIPSGQHEMLFKFEDTFVRKLAEFISLFTFLILIGWTLKKFYFVNSKR